MATLVLNRNAMSVALESDHLLLHRHVFEEGEPERETLPVKDVERVMVVGRPAISFAVLARFMDRGIPCCFMTRGGRWRGILKSGATHNARRRKIQYQRLDDPAFCLALSREIVRSKLRNCRRAIQRLFANRSVKPSRGESWAELSAILFEVDRASDLDALRGVEGLGSFHYFQLLGLFFPLDFPFTTRSRRPPLDEANALLSFAYTLLMNECLAAVELHGLDPGIGFMHQDEQRAPSLALDLMESFRPALADMLVLNLLNHGRFTPEDFTHDTATGGVYLSQAGRGKFFAAWEAMLVRRFVPFGETEQTNARQAIDRQVVTFLNALEKDEDATFFRLA